MLSSLKLFISFFQLLHVNWSSFTGAVQPAGNSYEVRCLWLPQLFWGWYYLGHLNPLGLFQHGVISKVRHDPFLEARRLLMRNFIRKSRLKVLGARLIIFDSYMSQKYLAVLMSSAMCFFENLENFLCRSSVMLLLFHSVHDIFFLRNAKWKELRMCN